MSEQWTIIFLKRNDKIKRDIFQPSQNDRVNKEIIYEENTRSEPWDGNGTKWPLHSRRVEKTHALYC